jgi:hypothetical protein
MANHLAPYWVYAVKNGDARPIYALWVKRHVVPIPLWNNLLSSSIGDPSRAKFIKLARPIEGHFCGKFWYFHFLIFLL